MDEETNKMRQHLKDLLSQLLAIEILEYHDKNWLSGNDESRNRAKRVIMMKMGNILENFSLDDNRNSSHSK